MEHSTSLYLPDSGERCVSGDCMKVCIAVALLALAGLVLADDKSTSDSSADSKPPASKETPTNGDKSKKKDDKLPSPGELIRKLKQAQQEENKKSKVAYFNLSRPIMEKPAEFSLFGGDNEF